MLSPDGTGYVGRSRLLKHWEDAGEQGEFEHRHAKGGEYDDCRQLNRECHGDHLLSALADANRCWKAVNHILRVFAVALSFFRRVVRNLDISDSPEMAQLYYVPAHRNGLLFLLLYICHMQKVRGRVKDLWITAN